jgi:surface carbohydrate biosynthesis protein
MNKKILFLVDHKHRDLPGLSLISYFLNHYGCQSKIVALGSYDEIIRTFDPEYIVLPKPNHDLEKMMSWRLAGRKIIIIDAEGNPQDKNFIYKIRVKPDLYIFWNNEIKHRYSQLSKQYNTVLKTLGFYRSDFLHPDLHDLIPSREVILKKYNLDALSKTITIATSTQDAHFSKKRLHDKNKRRAKSLEGTAKYFDIVNNRLELKEKTEYMINIIVRNFPDINLIIKPHPNENVVYWDNLIKKIDSQNVKLFIGEPINNLLKVSDFHIAHNVCTTTSEALLYGVPAIEMHCDDSKDLFSEEHLYIANFIINNSKDIIPIINLLIRGNEDPEAQDYKNKSTFSDYVDSYLYKYDGLRCFEYAKYLLAYMDKPKPKKIRIYNLFTNSVNILLYLVVKIRNKIHPRFRKQKKIDKEVNNVLIKNNRETIKINNKLVDKEYGLFDNRIKEGDEEYWYDKFKENKHIQDLLKR